MYEIKPIETYYDGRHFRSRLEAKWAVFFKTLGIKYEYEPEGYKTSAGYYLPDFRIKCYGTRGYNSADYFSPCFSCANCNFGAIGIGDLSSWHNCFCKFANPDICPEWVRMRRPPERTEIEYCKKYKSIYPFDLYIEVKGEMTVKDANKIKAFSEHYPILVIGNIPEPNYHADSDELQSYKDMNGVNIYPWNYETIDGDYFAAYPAVDLNGHFYLDGDDSDYQTADLRLINYAFDKARQARFEHGEKPNI